MSTHPLLSGTKVRILDGPFKDITGIVSAAVYNDSIHGYLYLVAVAPGKYAYSGEKGIEEVGE